MDHAGAGAHTGTRTPDVSGADVRTAAACCRAMLEPTLGADWSVPVPGLDFSVAGVVAHAANCVLWYALDLYSGTDGEGASEIRVDPERTNAALLTTHFAAAQLCAAALDAAPATQLGYHPFGAADPSGFAAMACDELLVHGADAAAGLAVAFDPPAELAARVLARLFPWHECGDDPWTTLLWANGRRDLPHRVRQSRWRWHCAPLADWDGRPPAGSGPTA